MRFPSIGIFFLVLMLLNGCSESSEKAGIHAVKSVTKKHFQDHHPTFIAWKDELLRDFFASIGITFFDNKIDMGVGPVPR